MNLITAIEQGIENAQKNYISWSNGWSISWSAEYILTVNIAQEVGKLKNTNNIDGIYVEHSVDEFALECNLDTKDSDLRSGRFDICIDIDEQKSTIIEVKNTIQHEGGKLDSIVEDIRRCQYFIENSKSVEDAYICFLVDDKQNSDQKIENKIEQFTNAIQEEFKELEFEVKTSEIHKEADNLYWASIVMRFFQK